MRRAMIGAWLTDCDLDHGDRAAALALGQERVDAGGAARTDAMDPTLAAERTRFGIAP